MAIKVFIVDDESLARDELKYLLSQYDSNVEIVGEASDGEEAIRKILDYKPDVIFLDIQMPGIDGITVANKLIEKGLKVLIVFATAYDEHAIKAFEVNAIDYLLKPFDEERVKITLERITQQIKKNTLDNTQITEFLYQMMKKKDKEQPKSISKLAVQHDDRVILLDPIEIIYAYREGREVLIKTFKNIYTSKFTLQALEEKLQNYPFFRTHRSYLVNLNYIQEMVPWFNGAYNLIMKDGQNSKVPVSRQYVKDLRDHLEL